MGFDPSAIEPDCTFPLDDKGKWDLYFSLLRTTLSSLLKEYGDTQTTLRALPIVKADSLTPTMNTFSLYVLTHAQYTQGSGRFITDALNTYLIPGKYTPILLSRSSRFVLKEAKGVPVFFTEYLIQLPEGADFEILKINLPKLMRNFRMTLSSVRYTRRLIQKRKISDIERELLVTENIQDLFELSNKKTNSPFFAHVPKRFIDELQKKESEELSNALLLNDSVPFKRSIFGEMHRLISLLPLQIQHEYSQRLLIRMLSSAYLFRKVVSYTENAPHLPKALFKVFPVAENHVVHRCGLLLVITPPDHAIQFDHEGLFRVAQRLFPLLRKNRERSFTEVREGSSCKTIYIELAKEHLLLFTMQDIRKLKHNLEDELELYIKGMAQSRNAEVTSKREDLVTRLQSQLIEKGRYNDILLSELVHSFSTSKEIDDEWIDALGRSYYMFYSLLDEERTSSTFMTAAHTVEDVFVVAVATENPQIHDKVSLIMLSEKEASNAILSVGFQFETSYLSALFFRYKDSDDLKRFRGHLLERLQRLQVEIEAHLA